MISTQHSLTLGSTAPWRILWAQGRRVQGQGIAVADELVRRNRVLGAAIRALTGEHAATCAAASAGREALSRLQWAHDQLQDQVGPRRMCDSGRTSYVAASCDDGLEPSCSCKPCYLVKFSRQVFVRLGAIQSELAAG